MSKFEPQYITACAVYEDASEKQIGNAITNATNVTAPDTLINQDTHINNNEFDEFELTFSSRAPVAPSFPEQYSAIYCNVIEEDVFHTHIYAEIEDVEDLLNFQKKLMSDFNDILLPNYTVAFSVDASNSEFVDSLSDITISSDNIKMKNMRLEVGDWNVNLAESADELMIWVSKRTSDEIEPSDLTGMSENMVEETSNVLEGLVE